MNNFKIKLKDGSARWEHFGEIHPRLGMILYYFCGRLVDYGVKEATITSIIRPKLEDTGIHAEGRGIDLADNFAREIGKKIEDEINTLYPYDKNRPGLKTVVYHISPAYGDAGSHYHLQVSI